MSDQSPAFESPAFPEAADEPEDELEDDELEDGELEDDEDDEDERPAAPARARADNAGGSAAGGRPQAVLEHIARSLVDDPEAVEVAVDEARGGLLLSLRVAPGDMGRVIGKRGRIAQALRAVVRAAAARDGTEASVDIVD